MNLRVSAQHAGWSIREAAWGFEERVLWRGSDATQEALDRAGHAAAPVQKLIQTKITWPLSDAYRARGRKTRAAIAASAAAFALAGGVAGGIVAAQHSTSTTESAASAPAPVVAVAPHATGHTLVLQGVTPRFKPGHAAVPRPAPPPAKPTEPAAQVAWDFAEAFVGYEIGTSDKRTQQVFGETATRPLAKTLADDPPRLPAKGKVPQARVLNVVMGSATKSQVTASVSLVRLRAVSELRLTLSKTGARWRVAQVLG
jgi:hypothetical protein